MAKKTRIVIELVIEDAFDIGPSSLSYMAKEWMALAQSSALAAHSEAWRFGSSNYCHHFNTVTLGFTVDTLDDKASTPTKKPVCPKK